MREAASYTESLGADSANTLLNPPDASDRDGYSLTELIQPHSGAVKALVVTVEQSVEDWLASNQDVSELAEELVIVSVGDGVRSTAATHSGPTQAPTPDPRRGEPVIEFVPDASDFSQLGQTINAHLSETPRNMTEPTRTIFYLDSISALLEAADTETVFRFLHTLTSLVNARGATAYYQLDSSQVDPETVSIILPLFDSEIEG